MCCTGAQAETPIAQISVYEFASDDDVIAIIASRARIATIAIIASMARPRGDVPRCGRRRGITKCPAAYLLLS